MRGSIPFLALAVAALPAASACSSTPDVIAMWTAPASPDALAGDRWLDLPFPSDLRRDAAGAVVMTGLYNPQENTTIAGYLDATRGLLDGFSTVASGYVRFTGDIDPATLPDSPPASARPDSSVQLLDVDPRSPEYGTRRMVQTSFRSQPPAEGSYWLPHTLAVMPAQGYPLRPHTRYALVVTKRLRAAGGGAIGASPHMREVLGLAGPSDATRAARAQAEPLLSTLDRQFALPADYVVSLGWFTTNDPTDELFRVADATKKSFQAPAVEPSSWRGRDVFPEANVYEAVYGPVPNYQAGNLPFAKYGDGGSFVFDKDGAPVVQSTFTMRMTLVVPLASRCPMPDAGYPIVLYAHGTGGDYRSIVSESHPVGRNLAAQCLASMGVDQIFHGTRPGAPPLDDPNRVGEIETLFFNFVNPLAARTNGRQAAVDVVQQARLFTVTHQTLPATVSREGVETKLDASRLLFVGHSQGGVNGPIFLAADDAARGGVLSGTGADIRVALLEKTKPSPSVAQAVRLILGLARADFDAELDLFHPALNLAQTLIDPTDPYVYMPRIAREPRPGFAPKSVYQTEGIAADGTGDSYAPPHGIEVASVALGLPLEAPGVHPVAEAAWSGLGPVTVPPGGLTGNLAGGRATGVLAQFPPAAGSDGHFVLFDIPAASQQAFTFCKNLAADPVGRVEPLQ